MKEVVKEVVTKNINIYPDLTIEDCLNEFNCSKIRKWILKRLMPVDLRFTKADTILTLQAHQAVASITINIPCIN